MTGPFSPDFVWCIFVLRIDATGGGGGSSFTNETSSQLAAAAILGVVLGASLPAPVLSYVDEQSCNFTWGENWDQTLWGPSTSFEVEWSQGFDSEDYSFFARINNVLPGTDKAISTGTLSASFQATGLQPISPYRFRVTPLFPKGRGVASLPLIMTTLAPAVNYWEPIIARRVSLSNSGRGFTNPVLQIPHLTPGVGIHGERATKNAMRYSDPDTSESHALPSPRRGHSLSTIGAFVFMFGGRTDGYTCASVYLDTVNVGNIQSGRDVYPCSKMTAEVSELWSWDLHSYTWISLNTTVWDTPPPPAREQHAAVVVDGDIFIFGGKTRVFPTALLGLGVGGNLTTFVFGDLWRLSVARPLRFIAPWIGVEAAAAGLGGTGLAIPEDRRLFIAVNGSYRGRSAIVDNGVSARTGMCLESVIVKVVLTHPCINQLRLSLMGPGPETGSPNFHTHSTAHEVLLYNQRKTNGTGCAGGTQYFTFDDESTLLTDQCCRAQFKGSYQPEGKLAEYIGASTSNEWTLVVQDMKVDGVTGLILDWELDFIVSPCVKIFTWHNLTAVHNIAPSAR